MTILPRHVRRAMLLGLACGVAACDIASFIQDPLPTVEQTWSIPAKAATIHVKELLPIGVDTTPDGQAFQFTVTGVGFQRRVGDDCAPCVPLNGTTAVKPSFVLVAGSSTPMPTNVVQATLVSGQVNLQVSNGFSFDPLRVKVNAPASTDPTQQGRMVIVVRSGSLVVGRDSLNGATTAFAPGAVLSRSIALQSGNIGSALAVDLTLTSPASDNAVPINANANLTTAVAVPAQRIATVRLNVVNKIINSIAGPSISLSNLDKGITNAVQGAALELTITNPFTVAGNVDVGFNYGAGNINKTLSLPNGSAQVRTVNLSAAEMSQLFGATNEIGLTISGAVNSTAPIDVTPQQVMAISNRLILTIRAGGSTICPKNFCIPSGGD